MAEFDRVQMYQLAGTNAHAFSPGVVQARLMAAGWHLASHRRDFKPMPMAPTTSPAS
jgi:hypothetical protein